jgi:hypothetical protein
MTRLSSGLALLAVVVTGAAVALPLVLVLRSPEVIDVLCGLTLLVCGLVVRGPGGREQSGALLLGASAAWSLPLLAVTAYPFINGLVLRTGLVHVALVGLACLVVLDRERAPRTVLLAMVALAGTALSGGIGEFSVVEPFSGAALIAAAVGSGGLGRLPALLLGGELVAAAAIRAVQGSSVESVLFPLHAVCVGGAAVLLAFLSRRPDYGDHEVPLDSAGLAELEASLATVLGLSDLGLWFPDGHGEWLNATGTRAPGHIPDGDEVRDGDDLLALVSGLTTSLPPRLVTTLHLVRDHARLRQSVTDQIVELRASQRRLLVAGDHERRDLERQLHAGALARIEEVLDVLCVARAGSSDALAPALSRASATRAALVAVGRGLDPLAGHTSLTDALRSLAGSAPVPVVLDLRADPSDDAVRRTLYFAVSEAIANTAKHGRGSTLRVLLKNQDDVLVATLSDDGPGGADPAGSGLVGLADRARAVGGSINVVSPPGSGTTLILRFTERDTRAPSPADTNNSTTSHRTGADAGVDEPDRRGYDRVSS